MKLIDLGIVLRPDQPSDPPSLMAHFVYHDHQEGISNMSKTFNCDPAELPASGMSAYTSIVCADHSGTHMDAPWHYSRTTNDGAISQTIEDLPLEWCISDCVCIHFEDKPNGYKVTAADLEEYFAKIDYKLKPQDIVLLSTGAAKLDGTAEYRVTGCGMSRESTLWLTRQGVKIVGTDAWSWDVPLPIIAKRFAETKDRSIIWEAHLAGREIPYFQMEKMTNLDKLPAKGFKLICIPIKIEHGSAGWVRPVAVLPDEK